MSKAPAAGPCVELGRVVMVIGVGNEYGRDDGAGLAVVTSLRDRVPPGVELVLTDG